MTHVFTLRKLCVRFGQITASKRTNIRDPNECVKCVLMVYMV